MPMEAATRRAPAWRSSCLALCLLPVALPLLLLCLPLLCVAVAVARFRRRRRRRRQLLLMTTSTKSRRCCPGGRSLHGNEAEGEGEGRRAAAVLLHKYLEDQMELVGAEAADAAAVAVDPTPSSRRSRREAAVACGLTD
ncbi:uncharacterized protein LOC8079719 [Sorghum bicolor]|uniref:Uncharacterized protein n=1 Tax=Sorghum bicolor TaxID=4558 RepID=A0A1Z5RGY9_SORBI|nr:uncharacterized protein LOC8079719 [Sorghum bicolor]OQU82998.1 hypothetical protein SORBI_3005G060400 [Sorghum bicolor]|eukprot:XP_002450411.2 uncharacterized protein LOC8079719 [Sorghum bicolor]